MPALEKPPVSLERSLAAEFMDELPSLTPEPPKPAPANGTPGPTGSTDNGGTNAPDGSTAEAPKETPQQPSEPEAKASETPPAEPEAKPAATPEAKPAEVKAEEPDEDKPPRNAQDWKNARAKAKEREESLRREIEQLKKATAPKPPEPEKPSPELELTKAELEKLRKEHEEYSKRIQMLDVTKHPRFEQHFNAKFSQQVDLAKRIVGQEKAAVIEEILKLPDGNYKDEKLNDFMADLSPIVNSRVGGILNSIEAIDLEKREAIAAAQAEREKLQAEQSANSKKAQLAAESTWKAIVSELQDPEKGLAVYQVKEGDTDWNNGILDRVSTAKKLVFDKNDPATVAKAALHAAAFPALLKDYKAYIDKSKAEIEALNKKVAALTAAQPAVQTQGKPAGKVAVKSKPSHDPRMIARDFVGELTAEYESR